MEGVYDLNAKDPFDQKGNGMKRRANSQGENSQKQGKNHLGAWMVVRRTLVRVCLCGIVLAGTAGASILPVMHAYASDKAVETVYLSTSRHAWWETDTVGRWNSVSKAHEYQVKLYIADDFDLDTDDEDNGVITLTDAKLNELTQDAECVMMKRTTETSYDFSPYMKDLHTYIFVVRAVPKLSEQQYVKSGDWVASPTADFKENQVQGITGGKWRNYLEGTKYETEDGEFLTGGWQRIQGVWYLFDENGYRLGGWQTVDGVHYYLDEDNGMLATGWFVWDDNWYYADKTGAVQTGWIMDQPGKYYYLNEDGTMAHDTVVDGYTLNSKGLRQ